MTVRIKQQWEGSQGNGYMLTEAAAKDILARTSDQYSPETVDEVFQLVTETQEAMCIYLDGCWLEFWWEEATKCQV